MLPSQQHSWTTWHGGGEAEPPAKVAASTKSRRRRHAAQLGEQRRMSKSGADISDTAASVEGEATLRLLADPELYADFQARIRQRRPATNVATHELLKEFLAEKKYCDRKVDQKTNPAIANTCHRGSGGNEKDQARKPPRTAPGRLGIFLQRNQERCNSQIPATANAGNGSLPSLEEVSEKKRMQRRDSMGVVSMASSSSISTHATSASTYTSSDFSTTDNSSFEVSLSGLVHPTSWFKNERR
mmetsp:Transcript_5548/g.15629  ORF Transcript_5548/g.15629 Transcript_5548/m.15629 type:complete len:243 (-) Transcript_5548:145-873(-)